MMYPVILSGGSGTRLWPLSRSSQPKQLLSLIGTGTMIQQTVQRLSPLKNEGFGSEYNELDMQSPIIVCNKQHRFAIGEQMQQIGVQPTIMLEPVARNTAPAIAAACIQAQKLSGSDSTLVFVLPSDHSITDIPSFHTAIVTAVKMARLGRLVTFGITARSPETGYGYIKADIPKDKKESSYILQQFTEKPDLATAKKYIADGSYFWNSGMFVFRADTFLAELKKFEPDIYMYTKQSLTNALNESDFIALDETSFSKNNSNSIDYAVMEKTKLGTVIPLDAGWSDVGSWGSLWEVSEKDASGNYTEGSTLLFNTKNCYIHNTSTKKIITTMGVQNLVIVDTDDALLVADKNSSQSIKDLVQMLKKQKRDDLL